MTQFEQLDLLLNEYGGIIQTFQVIDNGISKPVFGLSTLFQTNFFRLFFRYCTGV